MMVGMPIFIDFQPSRMRGLSWLGEHILREIDALGYKHNPV